MGIAATIPELAEGLIFQGKKSVESILRTENLWKLYRAGKVDVPALRGVNFEVQPGESVAVMGPSGCGKSSFLFVIGGAGAGAPREGPLGGEDLKSVWGAPPPQIAPPHNRLVFPPLHLLPPPHGQAEKT